MPSDFRARSPSCSCAARSAHCLRECPALLFSLLGGLSALLVMALLSGAKKLSIFGVSIAGAAAHNCGQVCAALITLGSTAPLYYLPFLLLVSLFTGALSGLITAFLFRAMVHTPYGTKGENQHG